jgi:hypothetical protein
MDAPGADDEGGIPPADGGDNGPFSDLPAEWAALVIPDDASALDAEAAQVRAELARERRRRRWGRWVSGGLWHRYGLSPPLVGLVLLVAASFASLLVVVLPSGSPLARSAPLARSSAPPGRAGGLLPDVVLTDPRGESLPVRDVRPGVVLLTGDHCDCESLIAEYTHATAEARVRLLVVGDLRAPTLPAELVRGRVVAATDPGHRLAQVLDPPRGTDPEAVLVRSDGVIFRMVPDARNVVSLRGELGALR